VKTKGWELKVEWKDSSKTSWETLLAQAKSNTAKVAKHGCCGQWLKRQQGVKVLGQTCNQ